MTQNGALLDSYPASVSGIQVAVNYVQETGPHMGHDSRTAIRMLHNLSYVSDIVLSNGGDNHMDIETMWEQMNILHICTHSYKYIQGYIQSA